MAPYQHAVKTKDGANAVISAARMAIEMDPDSWVGLTVGVQNAFLSVTHAAVETAIARASGVVKLACDFFGDVNPTQRSPAPDTRSSFPLLKAAARRC
jgi:hypothetical protein